MLWHKRTINWTCFTTGPSPLWISILEEDVLLPEETVLRAKVTTLGPVESVQRLLNLTYMVMGVNNQVMFATTFYDKE